MREQTYGSHERLVFEFNLLFIHIIEAFEYLNSRKIHYIKMNLIFIMLISLMLTFHYFFYLI